MDGIRAFFENMGEANLVTGEKLVDLSAPEILEWDLMEREGKELEAAFADLNLRAEEHSIRRKKWWRAIRKTHTLDHDHITYKDGMIYERVKRVNAG